MESAHRIKTREEWLNDLLKCFRVDFENAGHKLPDNIRVSVGFPSKRATAKCGRRIGEVHSMQASDDKTFEIFINPTITDKNDHELSISYAAVLVHELCHVAVGLKNNHNRFFSKCARALLLQGKMTSTVPSDGLKERLQFVFGRIGLIPHHALHVESTKMDKCRLVKVACPKCSYTVRTTRLWINVGLPTCVCGSKMEEF
jgi:hypothetical protein